ncbi:MAG TPA: cytochrome c peroxidase [Longimicrobiales bacterium]|nr:cytochrome c peroxidase [Longimicrobiales bacterium]
MRCRLATLSAAAALLLAGCSDGAAPPTGAPATDSLRARALAAGLAPLPERPPFYPTDNPGSPEKTELGHLLFFDPILSGARDAACSTCHLPRLAFADGRQFPLGSGAVGLGPERTTADPLRPRPMPRNSPTVFNVGVHGSGSPEPTQNGMMFWGGGAFGLEAQVLNPIAADNELRGESFPKAVAIDSVVARLRGIPEYVDRFRAAFPDEAAAARGDVARLVTFLTLRRALAAYLRELVTPQAPLDRFLRGDAAALDAEQKAGLALFIGKARCVACHRGPELSDFAVHVIGVRQDGIGRDSTPGDDLGHGENGDRPHTFRTAPLHQVAETAPYFHDGVAATLEDVVRFKNRGASEHPRVGDAELDPAVRPLGLTDQEVKELVAFLRALSDTITVRGPLFQAPAGVPSGLEVPK